MSQQAMNNILAADKQQEIKQLEDLKRVVNNALALVCASDVLIPVSHARAVPEIQDWLKLTFDQVTEKLDSLRPVVASVGQQEDKQVIDAQVVS